MSKAGIWERKMEFEEVNLCLQLMKDDKMIGTHFFFFFCLSKRIRVKKEENKKGDGK